MPLDVLPYLFIVGSISGYIAGALGLAYGAITVPALILLGVSPALAVETSLLMHLIVSPLGGLAHLKLGNVERMVFVLLLISGSLAASLGALASLSLPDRELKFLIGITTAVMGILTLVMYTRGGSRRQTGDLRRVGLPLIALVGLAAGFAAGAFGTGWGPIGVSSLILAGMVPQKAIGSSLLSRAFVALSGSLTYYVLRGVQLEILLPLVAGGLFFVILGAVTSNHLRHGLLRLIIGVTVAVLGTLVVAEAIV